MFPQLRSGAPHCGARRGFDRRQRDSGLEDQGRRDRRSLRQLRPVVAPQHSLGLLRGRAAQQGLVIARGPAGAQLGQRMSCVPGGRHATQRRAEDALL